MYGRIPAALLVMLFWGFCTYLLLDHEGRFDFELQTASLLPTAYGSPLLSLAAVFLFVGVGSLYDDILNREGLRRRPVLSILVSAVVLACLCLGFGLYLTTTHYTIAHDSFYITVIIALAAGWMLWGWGRSRLWF